MNFLDRIRVTLSFTLLAVARPIAPKGPWRDIISQGVGEIAYLLDFERIRTKLADLDLDNTK